MKKKYEPNDVERVLSSDVRNYLATYELTRKEFSELSGVSPSHITAIINLKIPSKLKQKTIDKLESAMVLRPQGSRRKPYRPKGFWAKAWRHVTKAMRF